MGKVTISMAMFDSKLLNYQRVMGSYEDWSSHNIHDWRSWLFRGLDGFDSPCQAIKMLRPVRSANGSSFVDMR